MSRTNVLLSIALTTGLLSACTSVSFKQGAGGSDFKADERACLGTTTERTAFLQCMQARGWWTRTTEEIAEITLVPVDDSESAAELPEAEAAAAAPSSTPTPASNAPAAASTGGDTAATAQPARVAVARDPLTRLRIAMWSKMGAGTPELIADQSDCVATLGEAHVPDTTAGTITRGMYECMKKRGWTALTFR